MHVHPPQWGACRSGPGLGGAQVDAIMKGSASGTAKHNVITEYMLTLLGLTYAADTQAPSPSPAPAAHRPTRPRALLGGVVPAHLPVQVWTLCPPPGLAEHVRTKASFRSHGDGRHVEVPRGGATRRSHT